jgi:hypothetical protein
MKPINRFAHSLKTTLTAGTLTLFFFILISQANALEIKHDLSTKLNPDLNLIHITDKIQLKDIKPNSKTITFQLGKRFQLHAFPSLSDGNTEFPTKATLTPQNSINRITIHRPQTLSWPNPAFLNFSYQGPIKTNDDSQGNSTEQVSGSGIVLSSQQSFYPDSEQTPFFQFKLKTKTPQNWKTVSQGNKISETVKDKLRITVWETDNPMESIYLIADQFHEYKKTVDGKTYYAFLREEEKELADKYLNATQTYIHFYQKLLPLYPFKKFALVENSFQTGYGMPSFTLLGSKIIRFPFILHTSYPHEILHNWWGNGVYISPKSGNWAEGLTSYLSDHLLSELKGKAERYRFRELTKYLNYVDKNSDFPLSEFSYRQDMASQAIGYGKMLMVFHMLRNKIGNSAFIESLQNFYSTNQFQYAGFEELITSFETTTGKDLTLFWTQWTTRKGAPKLVLKSAKQSVSGLTHIINLETAQAQTEEPFQFELPVGIWYYPQKNKEPLFKIQRIPLTKRQEMTTLKIPSKAGKILVDPYNDVFRKLDRYEVPPSIGQTFGAKNAKVYLPSNNVGLYTNIAQAFANNPESILTAKDGETFPNESAWVLGIDNPLADKLKPQLDKLRIKIGDKTIKVEGKELALDGISFAFTLINAKHPEHSVTWLVAGSEKAVPGLIRKLPHYGPFGYMVFEGDVPTNLARGYWQPSKTGLEIEFLPGEYILPPAKPLVNFKPKFSKKS